MMVGGPLDGKIMAYGGPAMPALVNGYRVGTYVWDGDHWEFDRYDDSDGDTSPRLIEEWD